MKHYVVRTFGIITYFPEDKVEFIPSWILKNYANAFDYLKKFNEKAAEEFLKDRLEDYFRSILSRYYEN